MSPVHQPHIVIVDDNEEDFVIFEQLLEKGGITNPILPFFDGADAIKYFGRVAVGQVSPPLVCFVDIKMPGYGGFEVLEAIRASEELDGIPTVIFSSSDDRRDILKSAAKGAQCYLVKHPKAETLRAIVEEARQFARRRNDAKAKLFKIAANLLPR